MTTQQFSDQELADLDALEVRTAAITATLNDIQGTPAARPLSDGSGWIAVEMDAEKCAELIARYAALNHAARNLHTFLQAIQTDELQLALIQSWQAAVEAASV
jgi:hypothetical protein